MVVSPEAKKSISEYYIAAQDLYQTQTIFVQKMREMEAAVNDKNIFLDIISTGTASSSTGDGKNDKRGRGTPRQDVPGAVIDPAPPKPQEAATECD